MLGVALLSVVGLVMLTIGLLGQQHAPQPPATAGQHQVLDRSSSPTSPAPTTGTTSHAITTPATTGPILARSAPRTLRVPAIGVHSNLLTLGLNPDNTIEVPPLSRDSRAGWYKRSPTPGQLGPSVVLGHVDSAKYGPGVFFKLGALHKGDTAEITRANHTVAVFTVDRVASYPKNDFPSLRVYGNTSDAELRLITCGGVFDHSAHSYENNIVVYAHLTSSHHA